MSKDKGNMTDNLLADIMQAQQPAPAANDPAPKMSKSAKTASVYLTAQQHAALERIARELGANKHNVMQLAIRHFIEDYDSGKYIPQPL